jgi:hypothetical protein
MSIAAAPRAYAEWFRPLSLLAAIAFAALPGQAALRSFQATLSLDAASLASIQIPASGQIDVPLDGSFDLPAGLFQVATTVVPPQTPEEVFSKVRFELQNAVGNFGPPGLPGGVMPLLGKVRLTPKAVFGFPAASLALDPVFVGGVTTVMVSNGSVLATAVLDGDVSRWGVGVFRQHGTTSSGASQQTRTHTGFDARTAMGGGAMNLVIPVSFRRYLGGGFEEGLPVTGELSITFAPEPATLSAQTAACGALLAAGAARRARS